MVDLLWLLCYSCFTNNEQGETKMKNEIKKLTAELEAFDANRKEDAKQFETKEVVTLKVRGSYSYKKSGQL